MNITKNKKLFCIFVLTTPLIYSFSFLNVFTDQIRPTDYPPDWYDINNYLNNDSQNFKILFFPWHMYMNISWINNTDKKIANPSKYFFDKEVLSGENIEAGQIYRQYNTPDQLYIDFLLKNRHNITNFGKLISILDIKYIILAKEADYKRYKFLFNQSDLKLIKDTKTLYLFKNNNNISRIYSVDNIYYIKNWNELLEKSKNGDITDSLYIIYNKSSYIENYKNENYKNNNNIIDYEQIDPVTFRLLKNDNKKFIIFTEAYSEDWKLDNKIPLMAYGVTNAYISDKINFEIRFDRFYKINLPSYIISIITFVILIIWYRIR